MSKKKNTKTTSLNKLIIAGVLLLVGFLVVISILLLRSSIDNNLYSERKLSLSDLTETSAGIVNESVESSWELADFFTKLAEWELNKNPDIEKFFSEKGGLFEEETKIFFFVDENGYYYSSDGKKGLIPDMEYYLESTGEKLIYLSSLPHIEKNDTYLIFRERLMEPISVNVNENETRILYACMLGSFDDLEKTVSELFGNSNNTFIYDSNGNMLYKKFNLGLLIDGYNIFSKMYKWDNIHGENVDDIIESVKNGETVIYNAELNGKNYFFCSAKIDISDWSLCLIIEEDYIEKTSGSRFAETIYITAGVVFLFALIILTFFLLLYKAKRDNRESEERLQTEKIYKDELSKALDNAREANLAKTMFLNNMSHDIRTPMNAVIGFTRMAGKNIEDKAKIKECLLKIEKASEHLLSLINDVLDMSRIEAGKVSINEEEKNIVDIIYQIEGLVLEDVNKKKQTLSIDTEGIKNNLVYCDGLRFNQVLINIVSNAVKYTKEGGNISIKAMEESLGENVSRYIISVKDNGMGMSEEFVKTVFDPFSRAENTTMSGIEGTGLGMSITKNLVDLMGGEIKVLSKEGEGSEFTVLIPFRIVRFKGASYETEGRNLKDLKGLKVLLAEDNELNREIAIDILGDEEIDVTVVTNGLEAVNKLKASKAGDYDLILMDIQMPVMDGYEAARQIRNLDDEKLSKIPIVAMTANAFREDAQNALKAGMNAHLSKPIDVAVMKETLIRILG